MRRQLWRDLREGVTEQPRESTARHRTLSNQAPEIFGAEGLPCKRPPVNTPKRSQEATVERSLGPVRVLFGYSQKLRPPGFPMK